MQIHKNVFALQNLQTKFRKLRIEAFAERFRVERKLRKDSEDLRKETVELSRNIPCYWERILTVADLNYNNFADIAAIKHLREVEIEELPLSICILNDNVTPAVQVMYKVHFKFDENPLMTTQDAIKVVSYKVCGYNNPDMEMLEPEVETEVPINWKPGKDPRVARKMKRVRKGITKVATKGQEIVPSFFHLFDDIKHEIEDGEYSEVIERKNDEDRKMQFKILMGFIREFVDHSIGYFDESIPNKSHYEINIDEDDSDEFDSCESDDSFMDVEFDEVSEIPDYLVQKPNCNTQ